jgi:hypothetical protein
MTFEEAFEKTGRVFCITLSSTTKKAPPVLLNYLTAPNVVIASAVVASAAVPGFVPPVRLQYKDANGIIRQQGGNQAYFDGSIRSDIPVNGLSEMLNCQFFITCQCNPHIVPFFYNSKGGVGRPSRWSSGTQEDSWRGGFLLAALEMYLKNDMKAKNVFLNDLEAAVGFTSTLLTQEFVGSTTIVPQVCLEDYFKVRIPDRAQLALKLFELLAHSSIVTSFAATASRGSSEERFVSILSRWCGCFLRTHCYDQTALQYRRCSRRMPCEVGRWCW